MKYTFFSLVSFFLLVHTVRSQVVADPIVDFLSRHADTATNELFPGEPWDGRTNIQPPGGYLLRFEAPIGPNGSPVLFIGSSILAELRTSSWSAYMQVNDHAYSFIADDVTFGSIPTFYLLSPKVNGNRGLAEIFAGKTSLWVYGYYIDKNGHFQQDDLGSIRRDQDEEESDSRVEDEETRELLAKCKLVREFAPHIEKILLAEYLKNPLGKR